MNGWMDGWMDESFNALNYRERSGHNKQNTSNNRPTDKVPEEGRRRDGSGILIAARDGGSKKQGEVLLQLVAGFCSSNTHRCRR